MAQAQHTPGPWTVENPLNDQLWIVQSGLQPYDWTPIAIVTDDTSEDAMDRGSSRPISKLECEANARVMAAAPDLVNASSEIIDLLDDWVTVSSLTANKRYAAALEALRSAVAKASGSEVFGYGEDGSPLTRPRGLGGVLSDALAKVEGR